jgi:hypothetical protein
LDKFAQANRATKWMAPQIIRDFTEATANTPLLPRDLLVSILYNRLAAFVVQGGKVMFPMPAYTDVSEALDAISQQIGYTIIRGPDGWIGVNPASALSPGALLYRTSTQALGVNTETTVQFQAAGYQDLAFWNAAQPADIVIPAGVNAVRLTAGFITADATGQTYAYLQKNGAGAFNAGRGLPFSETATTGRDGINLVSAQLRVTEGDYFRWRILQENGGDLETAWTGIEVAS